MFTYFGNSFIQAYPGEYVSKINGLTVNTDRNYIRLTNESEEAKEEFKHLYELLDGHSMHKDPSGEPIFYLITLPDLPIAEEPTSLSYFQDRIFEQMFIGSYLERRVATMRRMDDGFLLISIMGPTRDKCFQIQEIITSRLREEFTSTQPTYFNNEAGLEIWSCDVFIEDGFELIDGIYRIKGDIKTIIKESV